MKNNGKFKVTLTSLAFPDRDLSPALVGLKLCAQQDAFAADKTVFSIKQFQYSVNPEYAFGKLLEEKADLYGFSTYVWNIHESLALAEKLKTALPGTAIVFGGPEASGLAGFILDKYSFVDVVVLGEGEVVFTELLKKFCTGETPAGLAGIAYRDEKNGVVVNPPGTAPFSLNGRKSQSMDEEYLAYLDGAPRPVTVTFETMRGCPFKCRYCSWAVGGGNVRFKPLSEVFEGLKPLLAHPKTGRVFITDSDLFVNKKRGKEILRFLLENNTRKLPVIFEMNPELVDDEIVELVAQFDEDEFAFGLQSSSEAVLESINRKFNPHLYRQNVQKLRKAKPDSKIWFSLIVGLPGDTLETFKDSLNFAIAMRPHSLYIHEFLCLPGTEFYKDQEKYGISCQTEAPHKLLYHRTFSAGDYYQAKKIGFYVSLLHYFPEIKDSFFEMHKAGRKLTFEGTLLSLYVEFMVMLEDRIDLLNGNAVEDIPSFVFDEYYKKIGADMEKTAMLKDLFNEFQCEKGEKKYA
ncbi:MAG: radical SAM protein [Planctomycetes bacterium]|nr:radical SAM protein [Planctomycetota bacterium]